METHKFIDKYTKDIVKNYSKQALMFKTKSTTLNYVDKCMMTDIHIVCYSFLFPIIKAKECMSIFHNSQTKLTINSQHISKTINLADPKSLEIMRSIIEFNIVKVECYLTVVLFSILLFLSILSLIVIYFIVS